MAASRAIPVIPARWTISSGKGDPPWPKRQRRCCLGDPSGRRVEVLQPLRSGQDHLCRPELSRSRERKRHDRSGVSGAVCAVCFKPDRSWRAIVRPAELQSLDYEGELVAVIGKAGAASASANALEHVAGYSIFNDGSIRDFQLRTPQWTHRQEFRRHRRVRSGVRDGRRSCRRARGV